MGRGVLRMRRLVNKGIARSHPTSWPPVQWNWLRCQMHRVWCGKTHQLFKCDAFTESHAAIGPRVSYLLLPSRGGCNACRLFNHIRSSPHPSLLFWWMSPSWLLHICLQTTSSSTWAPVSALSPFRPSPPFVWGWMHFQSLWGHFSKTILPPPNPSSPQLSDHCSKAQM